jgi:hypothetical protein
MLLAGRRRRSTGWFAEVRYLPGSRPCRAPLQRGNQLQSNKLCGPLDGRCLRRANAWCCCITYECGADGRMVNEATIAQLTEVANRLTEATPDKARRETLMTESVRTALESRPD